MHKIVLRSFVCLTTLSLLQACSKDAGRRIDLAGDGDGTGASGEDGRGEGGDGDGDATTTGGDGDGDTTGGDPTGDGDGDGDEPTTGDGDGDGDGDPEPACNDVDDVVLYLSPDDSNSMSSPVQVRERVLNDGSSSLSATCRSACGSS